MKNLTVEQKINITCGIIIVLQLVCMTILYVEFFEMGTLTSKKEALIFMEIEELKSDIEFILHLDSINTARIESIDELVSELFIDSMN